MPAHEQRDNEGVLFKNDRRTKETQPQAKGKAMIGGVMYWVSAWTKEGNKGRFQSLAFTPMDEQPENGARQSQPARQSQRQAAPQKPFGDESVFQEEEIPF